MKNKIQSINVKPSDEFSKFHLYSVTGSDLDEDWYTPSEVCTVAAHYIDTKLEKYRQDAKWIKTSDGISPTSSFASLIFQYKNTVFAVQVIEHINNERIELDPSDESDFISESIANNIIPCYIKVFTEITPYSSKTCGKPS